MAAPPMTNDSNGASAGSAGRKPEQTFFDDPAIDKLMGVVMALATELYVQKNRQAVLERALAEAGVVDLDALAAEPSPEELAASAKERDAFVAHLMDNLLGHQVSDSA